MCRLRLTQPSARYLKAFRARSRISPAISRRILSRNGHRPAAVSCRCGAAGCAAIRAARVAIPTAATETAGQVTRQLAPEYEDAARLVAGILSGGGQALAEGGLRLSSGLKKLDTTPGGMSRVKQR